MTVFRKLCSAAPAVLAILTLGAVPSLVHAGSGDAVATELVRFGDLNLSTPGAVRTLYDRIQAAAHALCGPAEITGSRIVPTAWKACVSDSVRHAILTVNRPELTAYYGQRLGVPPTQAGVRTGR